MNNQKDICRTYRIEKNKEKYGNGLFLCLAIIMEQVYICFSYLLSDHMDDVVKILILALLFFSFIIQHKEKMKISVDFSFFLWLLFYLLAMISMLYTKNFITTKNFFLVYLLLFTVAFLQKNVKKDWIDFFLKTALITSGIHVLATMTQFFFPAIIDTINISILNDIQLNINRICLEGKAYAGITGQIGTNAFNITIFIAISFCFLLFFKKNKPTFAVCVVIGVVCLMLTQKRGLFLGTLFSMIFVFFLYAKYFNKNILSILPKIIAVLAILMIVISVIPETDIIFQRLARGGLSGREDRYEKMLELFCENPLLGIGFGVFSSVNGGMTAHSDYLRTLCEVGILGFSIFMSALIYSLWSCVRHLIKYSSYTLLQNRKTPLVAMFFSIYMQMFYLIYAFSGNPLSSYDQLFMYFLCLALGHFVPAQSGYYFAKGGERHEPI